MTWTDEDHLQYTAQNGGFTFSSVLLDSDDFEKAKEDKNIVESEEHTFGKYEGVYLRYHEVIQDGFFNQRIYLFCPEEYRVITIYVGDDVSKEDALKVADNLSELDAKSAKELVEEGKKGITAEFNGIVSKADLKNGEAVTQGMELFTLQNTDKVSVDINVSKYDYDKVKEGQNADITIGDRKYTGKVTKISHIATTNEKGSTLISATVSIDKPDKDIFLGVDAKVKIYAEKAEDVVTLPAGVVNIGKDGSFCYVLKDGVITSDKRIVEALPTIRYLLENSAKVALSVMY